MSAPRSSSPSSSVSVTESLLCSRSNLALSSSVLHQVEDLSINDEAKNPARTTRRPSVNIDDILAGLDRVKASLAECIGLAESTLHRPDGPQASYHEVLFTLPPNPVSSPDRREIFVVSSDEATINGEDEEAKCQRLHRNQKRQDRRNKEAILLQAEEDLRNADGRKPWDLGSVTQQPNESLRNYNKRYFINRNMIMNVDDRDIIHCFHQGLHNIELWRKMFETYPKTVSEMMVVVNKHADMEDAEKAHRHHKDRTTTSPQLQQAQRPS
ncbi:putative gag-pol precursor -orf1 [Panicum miliaceum]|uniref:Gag-pol-orf1 n=1 Tax=Panicum miliaceum TaxID=4540 RepID=A0A3L6Q4U6_PANMI|nr:putative gag-pol precursor -orf1 [Panicum miliaceum]